MTSTSTLNTIRCTHKNSINNSTKICSPTTTNRGLTRTTTVSAFQRKLDFFQTICTATRKQRIITATSDLQFNDIKLGKHLGSGGFGTVHECLIKGKKYALKRFHISTRNERAAQESFLSERLATQLIHRNIVRSLYTFLQNESRFILMEFLEARTLQSIVDDEPNEIIDPKRRIRFAKQICAGLAYAHRKKIAHLDLKPLNILVCRNTDECKIGDFGCCKNLITESMSPTTPTKTSLTGTYSYRAPELLRGEPATEKADIYSLGICLWQMVSRQRPYGNENHQVIIFKVVAYNLRPVIPKHTEQLYSEIMVKCWDQCKENRMHAKDILTFLNKHF